MKAEHSPVGRRRKAVIIGAGIAGSILAGGLADPYAVTVIDLASETQPLAIAIRDAGVPAGYEPHAGSGPGGTSAYWHNGLIVPTDADFASWPVARTDMSEFYAQAFRLLSGDELGVVASCATHVQNIHADRGIPARLLGDFLYYPKRRRNPWTHLNLAERPVTFLRARVRRLVVSDNGGVTGVTVDSGSGTETIDADLVLCCAGGLSSPLIIRETAHYYGLSALAEAGAHYHDHPTGFIAELRLNTRLHDIWNYTTPNGRGVIRTPLVVKSPNGRKVAFYLRPAVIHRQQKMFSVLSDLRNAPFNPTNIARLLRHPGELLEFASFMAGINLPTRNYSVLIAAEQHPSDAVAISADPDTDGIIRHWRFDDQFRSGVEAAFAEFLATIQPLVVDVTIVPSWDEGLMSAAHHSGTCRMAASPTQGIVDRNCRIFGFDQGYICDGSIIPGSGYANTGLSIAALSLRLQERLCQAA